jgi:hypothetical protein
VRDGERTISLGGRKQRTLLAILLLHANEVVSSDALIDGLWGERAPKTAGTALQASSSPPSGWRPALPATSSTSSLTSSTSPASNGSLPRRMVASRAQPRRRSTRRSRSGAASHSPTSRTTRSPRARSPASTSCT